MSRYLEQHGRTLGAGAHPQLVKGSFFIGVYSANPHPLSYIFPMLFATPYPYGPRHQLLHKYRSSLEQLSKY